MKNTFYLNLSSADNLGIGLFKYAFLPQERFIIVNSALSNMLGVAPSREFKKAKLANFFANLSERDEFFKRVRMDGKVNFFEAVFKTIAGKNIWVAITCSLVSSRDKKEYLEGIIENISAHKEMEDSWPWKDFYKPPDTF